RLGVVWCGSRTRSLSQSQDARMTIACLGWGSLVWQRDRIPTDGAWFEDGPTLPLEFARHSNGDRITLVIMRDWPVVPVLWSKMRSETVSEAAEALRRAEGRTKAEWIGWWSTTRTSGHPQSEFIGTWASEKGLTGVVWAAFPPKWGDVDG